MRLASSFAQLCAAVTIIHLSDFVLALPKVSRAGRYLYSEDGTRFYIKGVAYQEQGLYICLSSRQSGLAYTLFKAN